MPSTDLTTGAEFLRDAARSYFEEIYEHPMVHVNAELHKNLRWTPALRLVVNEHVNVFVEPSDTGPYPRIFEMRHPDVLHFPEPIAVYSVCPEEIFLIPDQRSEVKRLREHGYGLITVNTEGEAHREFTAIPLVQVIPRAEYKAEIAGLTRKQRQRIGQAYEDYNNKPVTGVSTLTEVVEGMIVQAGRDAVCKNYVTKGDLGSSSADILDALYKAKSCSNARAAIGGVRSYMTEYRNLSHHWPKNKKKAHQKYSQCRHAFLDGIKHIRRFRTAMRSAHLSGNLPKSY